MLKCKYTHFQFEGFMHQDNSQVEQIWDSWKSSQKQTSQ